MKETPQGFVRRTTLLAAVLAAFLVGGYVGGMTVLLVKSNQAAQEPTAAGLPGQGMPPGMGQGKPGQGMPPGMGQGMSPGMGQGMPPGMGQASAEMTARILELEKALAAKPGQYDLLVDLGNLYFDSEQPAKSIAAYEKALAIKGDNPDVWTDKGVMHRHLGEAQKALECFDKAIALNPGHEVSRFNKGIVALHDLNQPELALRTWEDLLAVKPSATTPDGRPLRELLAEMRKKKEGAAPAPAKP